jgi:multiple sugar transport system permease protein
MTRRISITSWLRAAVLLALGAFYVVPIAVLLVGSLKPDERVLVEAGTWAALWARGASLANYADVFERVAFARFLGNSLLVTGGIVGLGLAVNSAAGYALARLRWRGRGIALGFVLALLVVPFEAIAVPLFFEVTLLGWRDTYHVQILPFVANPLLIYFFYTFFLEIPRELEESARIDGAGTIRVFLSVAVPLARPAFGSAAVLAFLMHWGSYLWPLLVTSGPSVRPLPVAIAAFHTLPPRQWGDILAFGVMMVAPILVAFLAFQKTFFRGATLAGSGR